MKTFWILALILASLTGLSQNHLVGFKGGVLLSNSKPGYNYSEKSSSSSFAGGLTYDYQFERTFVLRAELLYSQYGFKTEAVLFGLMQSNTLTISSKYFYNYLTLPLLAGLRYGSRLSGYFNIGLVPSILISAKSISDFDNFVVTGNLYESVKNFDLPVIVEIGTDYIVNETILLFATFSYQHSFISFTEPIIITPSSHVNTLTADPQLRHYGFLTSIGLKFRIGEMD